MLVRLFLHLLQPPAQDKFFTLEVVGKLWGKALCVLALRIVRAAEKVRSLPVAKLHRRTALVACDIRQDMEPMLLSIGARLLKRLQALQKGSVKLVENSRPGQRSLFDPI